MKIGKLTISDWLEKSLEYGFLTKWKAWGTSSQKSSDIKRMHPEIQNRSTIASQG